jgi:hypothetical protein
MLKWKIYTASMSLLYLGILYSTCTKPDLNNLLDAYASTFALVALWGFCLKRKIFFKDFWKYSFVMCVIVELFNLYLWLSSKPDLTLFIITLIGCSLKLRQPICKH